MDHGPQMHGAMLAVLALVAVAAGLLYLVMVRVKGRRSSYRGRNR